MATPIFLLSSAFLVYVVLVYPLLVAVASRIWPRPIRKDGKQRSVSIIIAVRNGERWIEQKLESILRLDYPRELLEIIVVLDGCTDRTEEIARHYTASGVQILILPPGGKPAALNAGIAQAHGEILFFTDVRQALDRESLGKIVACFGDPSVGVVSGELMILTGNSEGETAVSTYWKYEKWVRMNVSILHSFPGATGCIYAMRRKLAVPIPAELLVDDVYQPLHAYFRGYRVCFEPGARAYDHPTSLSVEFHRKVRTLAGVYQIIGYFPRLLLPTHGMWIHFLSHKFSRLLLPYALIATAVTSFWLPYPWCVWAVAAQGTFYTLALLNRWIPAEATIKRITAPIQTFVVLIAAAACATSILFISSRRFWKATQVQVTPYAAGPGRSEAPPG